MAEPTTEKAAPKLLDPIMQLLMSHTTAIEALVDMCEQISEEVGLTAEAVRSRLQAALEAARDANQGDPLAAPIFDNLIAACEGAAEDIADYDAAQAGDDYEDKDSEDDDESEATDDAG